MNDADNDPGGAAAADRRSQREDAILSAALEEFSAKGFAQARLDDVARRAGVAKGTIYLYVESKEDLFRAVARRSVVPLVADLTERIESFGGPTEDLLRMIMAGLRQGLANPDVRAVVYLVLSEAGRFPDIAEFYHREVVARGMAAVRRVIARGIERGELRPNAVADFPQIFIAPLLVGTVWQELFDRFDPIDLEGLFDAHIDTLLHGIGGPRP